MCRYTWHQPPSSPSALKSPAIWVYDVPVACSSIRACWLVIRSTVPPATSTIARRVRVLPEVNRVLPAEKKREANLDRRLVNFVHWWACLYTREYIIYSSYNRNLTLSATGATNHPLHMAYTPRATLGGCPVAPGNHTCHRHSLVIPDAGTSRCRNVSPGEDLPERFQKCPLHNSECGAVRGFHGQPL